MGLVPETAGFVWSTQATVTATARGYRITPLLLLRWILGYLLARKTAKDPLLAGSVVCASTRSRLAPASSTAQVECRLFAEPSVLTAAVPHSQRGSPSTPSSFSLCRVSLPGGTKWSTSR